MEYFKKFKELIIENDKRPYLLADDNMISYAQLHSFALSIADRIAKLELNQFEAIALCFDSRCFQVIATWGCVFSEHPFFPINLNASPERLLQASKITRIVLTDNLILNKKFKGENSFVIEEIPIDKKKCLYLIKYETCLEGVEINKYPEAFYLMQTSGSTGTPKIVIHDARSAYSFVSWSADYLKINEEDRLLSISPLFFDMSILDLFASAFAKCTLNVPNPSFFMFPRDFYKVIFENEITTLYLTPSLLQKLISHHPQLPTIKRIILAGEDFDKNLLNKLKFISPRIRIYNFYGPTETNVCLYKELTQINEVLIGNPCPYSSVLLYDSFNQSLSENIGEVLVSGATVALGYLDQNFADDKLQIDGIDYYKTGDLAEITPDGLKFLGRLDHQIKIAGYRVSLIEVENYIHKNLNSFSVKALLYEEKLYVIILGDISNKKKEELHLKMKKELPSFMVPYRIFKLKKLEQDGFSDNLKVSHQKLIEKLILQEKISS